MPPITQPQGSRGGLITALVIFAILFLTSAIFAIYFNVNMRAEQAKFGKLENKYKSVISDASLSADADVQKAAQTIREQVPPLADTNLKVVDVLLQRGDRLGKLVSGDAGTNGLAAEAEATARVAAANERLLKAKLIGVKVQPDNLLASIDGLVKALIDKDQQVVKAGQDAAAKASKELAEVEGAKASIAAINTKVAEATAEAEKARADAAKDRSEKQSQVEAMSADLKKTSDEQAAAVEAKQLDLTALAAKNSAQEKEIGVLRQKLGHYRLNTTESTVRRHDGVISGLGRSNTVYINLGQGQGVVAGMTFEVYDRAEGVPAQGENGLRDDELPVGKGSIEIVRVDPATSECRVVKTTPGMTIAEGDVIANLVYDQNVKYTFVVYGKYDLDRNGVPTDADTDVMKRLVTQWGGKITDQVNVNTDFVVLGSEPVLPNFSKEDLDLPENAKKLADAQVELDAYQKVKADSRELHIPVMNQNRFLYFVGYYDQSKR